MPELRTPPETAPPVPPLTLPVTVVSGVGPDRAAMLQRLGIRTVGDLLLHGPRRYEDRRAFAAMRELQLGVGAVVRGHIVASGVKWFRGRTRSVYEFILDDGTARLHCRWWNLPFLERMFAVGDDLMVFGKPNSLRPRTMDHPETERVEAGDEAPVHLNRVVPIYPSTEGLTQRVLRGLVWRALERFGAAVTDPEPVLVPVGSAPDGWPGRSEAVRTLHFPENLEAAERARGRLALDEFVALQFEIQRRRRNLERNAIALPCGGDNRLIKPFLAAVGFKLTGAQTHVLREIRADLAGPVPMRRLLQGDVGSGKTLVAACAALMALENGWNVAVMAPTEILAGQLADNFRRWFEPLGIPVDLRTSAQRGPAVSNMKAGPRLTDAHLDTAPIDATGTARTEPRPTKKDPTGGLIESVGRGSARAAREAVAGAVPSCARLTVGTHALIQPDANFERLGLVVIDEQHKFGVAQREALVRKGRYPHLLVMTATPIPRTLGLTLYGDLDVSVIDQSPAGRGRIRTHVRTPDALPKVWEFLRRELTAGRQAYVVYARVDESEHDDVKAVTKEFVRVKAAMAPHVVGLLHGQLRPEEKDAVMSAFRSGAVQVLVATTVIEVGVDVPNATVMVIENAEQFGLAQLHQLRGRVGRGGHESHCILVADQKTEAAQERLKVLAATTDGFALAEADLRLRGPGELLGKAQSGLPSLRFGDLRGDRVLVEKARAWVKSCLSSQPLN